MAEITVNIATKDVDEVVNSLCNNEFAAPSIEEAKEVIIKFVLGKVHAKRTAANTVNTNDIELT